MKIRFKKKLGKNFSPKKKKIINRFLKVYWQKKICTSKKKEKKSTKRKPFPARERRQDGRRSNCRLAAL